MFGEEGRQDPINVVWIDDDKTLVDALREVSCDVRHSINILDSTTDPSRAVDLVNRTSVDSTIHLVLVDLCFPRAAMSGHEVIDDLIDNDESVRIIVLSSYGGEQAQAKSTQPQVLGFVSKEGGARAIFGKIRELHMREQGLGSTEWNGLAERCLEVIHLLVSENSTTKSVARQLGVKHASVNRLQQNAREKHGCKNNMYLAAWYLENYREYLTKLTQLELAILNEMLVKRSQIFGKNGTKTDIAFYRCLPSELSITVLAASRGGRLKPKMVRCSQKDLKERLGNIKEKLGCSTCLEVLEWYQSNRGATPAHETQNWSALFRSWEKSAVDKRSTESLLKDLERTE